MNIPTLERISDYVAYHADAKPEAEALILRSERITYEELNARVDELSRSLIASGVKKGDRIATLCAPHPDYFVCFLAAASVGAIWVGLNPVYQLRELLVVLSDCKPRLLFARTHAAGRDYSDELREIGRALPSIGEIVILDDGFSAGVPMAEFLARAGEVDTADLKRARIPVSRRDPCLLVYTSGSTGAPKGAILHHEGLVGTSIEQNRVWPVSTLRTLNYFPINHVGCVADVSCPTLVSGGCIVFLEKFDPGESLRLIEQEKITCLLSVPSVYQLQLQHPEFTNFDLSSVELIIWEGAAMPREMIERLLTVCPRLATNYSMTESTGAITVREPTNSVDDLADNVGFPARDVDVRIMDEQGTVIGDDREGEIQTRSRFNMLGYWNNPEASAAAFMDGWFRTGDVAARRADGAYRIVGRLKEMYKSGGYNVYPREVEAVLESCPGINLAAVVAVPDPLWQEIGVAFLVSEEGVTADEVAQHCRDNLANYKIPKRIVLGTELPLLPIGKVDKVALRKIARTEQVTGERG